MDGNSKKGRGIFSWLGMREVKRRTIIVRLKSDNHSREMLLRLLHFVVARGDSVLAVHVQESDDDAFDPNTFHIHEDLCKSKQVDFEIKICSGSCHVTELSHQVRITYASILAVGCGDKCPKNSTIVRWLKALPPTCKLLIINNEGKILCQKMGTSQEGSSSKVFQPSISSLSEPNSSDQSGMRSPIRKSMSMPSASTASTSQQTKTAKPENYSNFSPKLFERLDMLEAKGFNRRFTFEELNCATGNFGLNMLIGEGVHSLVYKAVLENGQAAVKVLKTSQYSEELFFREVEILSCLTHDNIIQLIGFCCCEKMYAIVYNLLSSSLKQRLNQLKWSERMQVAVGVAKALEYLHSCCPPIVHKDVNSSNILLSADDNPQLSDFGAAKVHMPTCQPSPHKKPIYVIGTLGYLAPEYITYGKVDEKIDVYSYGVVLLELVTGRAAFQTSPLSNQESLVLWARSLLNCGLYERLIDPNLKDDYNKDEMRMMMIAARLCVLHSSSRRPTMKTLLRFLEEPNNMLEMQKKREDLLGEVGCKDENYLSREGDSDNRDSLVMDNA